jgi:hypothetical protein
MPRCVKRTLAETWNYTEVEMARTHISKPQGIGDEFLKGNWDAYIKSVFCCQ